MTPTEINLASMFLNEGVLPTQTEPSVSRWAGERRLMIAVLEEATHALFRRAKSDKSDRIASDAREWIESDGRTWPFSFVNICESLDINPDWFRQGIALALGSGLVPPRRNRVDVARLHLLGIATPRRS